MIEENLAQLQLKLENFEQLTTKHQHLIESILKSMLKDSIKKAQRSISNDDVKSGGKSGS